MPKIELKSDSVYTADEIKKMIASATSTDVEVIIHDDSAAGAAVEDAEKKLEDAHKSAEVEDISDAGEALETPDADGDDDDTVVVNKAVWEDTLRRAALGDEQAEADKHERAVALIDNEGIKKGRLLGWQRDAWIAKAVENYDRTKASLNKLAPGLIPLDETGRGGSDEQRQKDPKLQLEKADAAFDDIAALPTEPSIY